MDSVETLCIAASQSNGMQGFFFDTVKNVTDTFDSIDVSKTS
jgi:hypothetical protein